MKKWVFSVFFLALFGRTVSAQSQDILWAVQNAIIPFSDQWSVQVKPIIRMDEGYTELLNASVDLSLHYKASKRWSFMILNRTFHIPDAGIRNFIFLDAKFTYSEKGFPFAYRSYLRYHLAFDIHDRMDPNFLRINNDFRPNLKSKIIPLVGIEPFFQLDGVNNINRVRYKVGFVWKFRPNANFNVQYWQEQFYNISPSRLNRILVVTMNHTIDRKKD